jgi:hypothetical protein
MMTTDDKNANENNANSIPGIDSPIDQNDGAHLDVGADLSPAQQLEAARAEAARRRTFSVSAMARNS